MSMKKIGSVYYVHKSNIQELLDMLPDNWYKTAINYKNKYNQESGNEYYEVIKYDTKNHRLSFIASKDWFDSNEPEVGFSYCFNLDTGNMTFRNGGNAVYHSKELFMSDDTDLIDIDKAKERTKLWQSLVTKEEKKLIGNKNYWRQFCEKHGIDL